MTYDASECTWMVGAAGCGMILFLLRGLGVVGFCTTKHNLIVKR